jgi:hypothetical protein
MSKTMRMVAVGLVIGAAALVLSSGDVAAQPPITTQQAKDLSKCQDAVAKGGQKFLTTKLKLVEKCGTERVEAQLKCAAGDSKCLSLLDKAEELCFKKFEDVLPASTKFIDDVLKACEPVESLIFGPDDPLLYQALIALISDIVGEPVVVTTVAELAGALCVGKELLVDVAAFLEVPAGLDPFELLFIPLDDRCTITIGSPV